MYILDIDIKEDRQVIISQNNSGNIYENNATVLRITIPKKYSSYYKYMDIIKDNKEKTQTVVSVKDEHILSYSLPDTLTGVRELTCQLILKNEAEVFKSNLFVLSFSGSINATQSIENKCADTIEYLMENKADREEIKEFNDKKLEKSIFYSFRDTQDETNNLKADKAEVHDLLAGKVDKEEGKGLSTNDFSDNLKDKLNNLYSREEIDLIEEALDEKAEDARGIAHSVHGRIDALSHIADENFNLIANSLCAYHSGEQIILTDAAENSKLDISVNEGVTVTRFGKNLIPYPYKNSTKEQAGVKYTDNGDGTITASGNATAYSDFVLYEGIPLIKKGYITFTVGNKFVNMIGTLSLYDSSNTALTQFSYNHYNYNTPIVINLDDYPETAKWIILVKRNNNGEVSGTICPQIEIGKTATGYEEYKEPVSVIAGADGKISNLTALSPTTTLVTDTEGERIECNYFKDVNKAFEELKWMIISLGGNV